MLAVVSEPVEEIRQTCRLAKVRLLVNPDPSRGQISSLRCALQAVPDAAGLLVILVDQGRVKAHTVDAVRKALPGADLVVARHRGQPGHPTAFSRNLFDALRSPLTDGGAHALVEAQARKERLRWVDVDDPGVIRNINTPQHYEAFVRACGLSPPP